MFILVETSTIQVTESTAPDGITTVVTTDAWSTSTVPEVLDENTGSVRTTISTCNILHGNA